MENMGVIDGWTVTLMVSCIAILAIVIYLNWHPKYCVGPIRAVGFGALAFGCLPPVWEIFAGSDYKVFPATAIMAAGNAFFLLSHWIAFEIKSRKKRGV